MLSTATNLHYLPMVAAGVVTIPIGATDIGICVMTGTAIVNTVDGDKTITAGEPSVNKLGPVKQAMLITFGTPGTGVVEYCTC